MPVAEVTIGVGKPEEEVEGAVTFRILRDGKPVEGAVVNLCDKSLNPVKYSAITDENGLVAFYPSLMSPLVLFPIVPPILPPPTIIPPEAKNVFEATEWFFVAYIPNSEYAVWQDNVKFKCGETYTYSLKRYSKAPELYIRIECSDIIGSELFGTLVARIQSVALQFAGLRVTRIEGEGTKKVTIYFSPPFSEHSPIVIDWAAVWFILKVLAVFLAIVGVLYFVKWTFGEAAPPIAGGALLVLGLFALAALKPPERRE